MGPAHSDASQTLSMCRASSRYICDVAFCWALVSEPGKMDLGFEGFCHLSLASHVFLTVFIVFSTYLLAFVIVFSLFFLAFHIDLLIIGLDIDVL